LTCTLQDPALFYASCYTAFCYQHAFEWMTGSVSGDGNRDQHYAQLCLAESVQHLRQSVSNANKKVSDAMLLTVLLLGTHTWELSPRAIGKRPRTLFRAPLDTMQWVDLHSAFVPDGCHLAALMELLRLRGGVDKVSLPGFSALIS
jgi:hypothetical protein